MSSKDHHDLVRDLMLEGEHIQHIAGDMAKFENTSKSGSKERTNLGSVNDLKWGTSPEPWGRPSRAGTHEDLEDPRTSQRENEPSQLKTLSDRPNEICSCLSKISFSTVSKLAPMSNKASRMSCKLSTASYGVWKAVLTLMKSRRVSCPLFCKCRKNRSCWKCSYNNRIGPQEETYLPLNKLS